MSLKLEGVPTFDPPGSKTRKMKKGDRVGGFRL